MGDVAKLDGGMRVTAWNTSGLCMAIIASAGIAAFSPFKPWESIRSPFTSRCRATPRGCCINNLRQIEGAKEQWWIEAKKTTTDTPLPDDLYGASGYVKQTPTCPSGGTYVIGSLGARPKCSVAGHSL